MIKAFPRRRVIKPFSIHDRVVVKAKVSDMGIGNPFHHDLSSQGMPVHNEWTLMFQANEHGGFQEVYFHNSITGQRISIEMLAEDPAFEEEIWLTDEEKSGLEEGDVIRLIALPGSESIHVIDGTEPWLSTIVGKRVEYIYLDEQLVRSDVAKIS